MHFPVNIYILICNLSLYPLYILNDPSSTPKPQTSGAVRQAWQGGEASPEDVFEAANHRVIHGELLKFMVN